MFTSPNSITNYLYSLNLVQNTVFYSFPLAMRILWKAYTISTFMNYHALEIYARVSLIRSKEYLSFFIIAFKA
jgi:hypothetical protein